MFIASTTFKCITSACTNCAIIRCRQISENLCLIDAARSKLKLKRLQKRLSNWISGSISWTITSLLIYVYRAEDFPSFSRLLKHISREGSPHSLSTLRDSPVSNSLLNPERLSNAAKPLRNITILRAMEICLSSGTDFCCFSLPATSKFQIKMFRKFKPNVRCVVL